MQIALVPHGLSVPPRHAATRPAPAHPCPRRIHLARRLGMAARDHNADWASSVSLIHRHRDPLRARREHTCMRAPRQASPRPTDDADVTTAKATIERRKPELDARLLRTFVTIVDLRSFTRAGRRLGLSQSAISQQIAAQERQLGVKLLVRAGKGVRPTPAGEILLHYARQILQKVDEAQRMLTVYDATGASVLRIGAGGAACEHLLPPILQAFHDEFPRVELRVQSGPSPLIDRTAARGRPRRRHADAADGRDRSCGCSRSGATSSSLIAAPTHAWAGAAPRRGAASSPGSRCWSTSAAARPITSSSACCSRPASSRASSWSWTTSAPWRAWCAPASAWPSCRAGRSPMTSTPAGWLACRSGRHGLSRAWGLGLRAEDHQPQTLRAFVRLCLERLPPLLTV